MDANEAITLLSSGAEGVAQWNKLRSSGQTVPTDLLFDSRLDQLLENRTLDLSGADLGGCSLKGSNLDGAILAGAHLYRADFSEVSLQNAKLTGAYLLAANFSRARLSSSDFSRCDLREACFCEASGPAHFAMAQLERADLRAANFDNADFSGANLADANLDRLSASGAHFSGANLQRANLHGAQLQNPDSMGSVRKTRLDHVDFSAATAHAADFSGAVLSGANLSLADFSNSKLTNANLERVHLIETNLQGAALSGALVYGISAWDLLTDEQTRQGDLSISRLGETAITVDDLEIAQFMYLLLNNAGIRRVIDSITSKVVLILGRFTEGRKPVLDALRQALRGNDFDLVPVVFDFSRPVSRTTAETITTLSGMARFVVADLTDARSVLQELMSIVPTMPSLPVQSLLMEDQEEPGMLDMFHRYPWFLEVQRYRDTDDLLNRLAEVIRPAITMSGNTRGHENPPPPQDDHA